MDSLGRFYNTESVEKEFCFKNRAFIENLARYPKIIEINKILENKQISPPVSLYPAGKSNFFSLRIDADEVEEQEFLAYLEIFKDFKEWITIFCCASSFVGKEKLLMKCIELGIDVQSHGFYHHLYRDYENNSYNISKAKEFFEKHGIQAKGFAAPMGRFNKNLVFVLERLGFIYSSDFSFDYLNMPLYPRIGRRFSRILEVPIFPVCPELLFASGLQLQEVIDFYAMIIKELKNTHIPIIIYAHTDKRYPKVKDFLIQLLRNVKNDDQLHKANLTSFVNWCISKQDRQSVQQYGLLNLDFYSGSLKLPDTPFFGKTNKQKLSKKIKTCLKNMLDFECMTPKDELKGNEIRNRIKVFLRKKRKS